MRPARFSVATLGRDPRRGFTLIELLISIGIMGSLAAIVILSVGVDKTYRLVLDLKRDHDVNQLEKAFSQRFIETGASGLSIPVGQQNAVPICRQGSAADSVCISVDTVVSTYLAKLPLDQSEPDCRGYSGYSVYLDTSGRPHILADHMGLLPGETASSTCRQIVGVSFPRGNTAYNSTLTFPQFNPATGTLTKIDIIGTGSSIIQARFENMGISPGSFSYLVNANFTLSGNAFSFPFAIQNTASFSASAFDGILDFGGTSGYTYNDLIASRSTYVTITDPLVLAQYTGTGTLNASAVATATSSTQMPGTAATALMFKVQGNLQLVYHYTK